MGRIHADLLTDPPSPVARGDHSEGRCLVEDLGSTNGTRVNGESLAPHQPRALRDGDEISFGGVSLRVALPENMPHPRNCPRGGADRACRAQPGAAH